MADIPHLIIPAAANHSNMPRGRLFNSAKTVGQVHQVEQKPSASSIVMEDGEFKKNNLQQNAYEILHFSQEMQEKINTERNEIMKKTSK